jgi:hypothetical protein
LKAGFYCLVDTIELEQRLRKIREGGFESFARGCA